MNKYYLLIKVLISFTFLFLISGCATQRKLVPPGTIPSQKDVPRQEEVYGQTVLQELSQRYPVEYSDVLNERVRNIVNRLTTVASADNNVWNVFVLQGSDVLNAAATRGNYVFVWTGLLNFVKSDDELATVLGHEIGHVLAGHTQPTAEDEVNEILVGIAGVATNISVGPRFGRLSGELAKMIAQAIFINPGRQKLELEADHIGLFMMARSGYDPQAAIDLWQRLAQSGSSVSEGSLALLSSHPPSKERIQQLKDLMLKAQNDYLSALKNPSKVKPRQTYAKDRIKKEGLP